jgi:AraC family transcriptional regulator of adaptative response/methylated-DNA-[protein]-cysteine methyltransferase
MEQAIETGQAYTRIADALEYLATHFEEQPSLDDVASRAGLSRYHFQRLFTEHVGISPKKFTQHLTLNRAKESLASDDLFVTHEAMTPGEWKSQGAGLDLVHGWHASPFGDCLIVAGERGVCGLAFSLPAGRESTRENLFTSLGEARSTENSSLTEPYAEQAFGGGATRLLLRGTPFQIKVWEALLRIPSGAAMSYEGLARAIGRPGAARAVAGAVARNPVSWLVPCHRVIRATGAITGYRWGPSRKRAILAFEAAQAEAAAA